MTATTVMETQSERSGTGISLYRNGFRRSCRHNRRRRRTAIPVECSGQTEIRSGIGSRDKPFLRSPVRPRRDRSLDCHRTPTPDDTNWFTNQYFCSRPISIIEKTNPREWHA